MIKKTVLALAGVAAFGTAYASNWVPLSTVATKDSTFMIDADSIVNEPNGVVRAWFLQRLDAPRLQHGANYDSVKFIERLYCKARLISAGPAHWYYGDAQVYAEPGYVSPGEIVPDSVGDAFFGVLCTKKKMDNL